jgi:hypothetical protein
MTLQSLIPVGREVAVVRPESNPFATLQQENDRLFDGSTRNCSGFRGLELFRWTNGKDPRQHGFDFGGTSS